MILVACRSRSDWRADLAKEAPGAADVITLCSLLVGRDLIGVQNLQKKHQALLTEVAGHEPRIQSVCDQGAQMIDAGHYAAGDIQQKIDGLNEKWAQLTVS